MVKKEGNSRFFILRFCRKAGNYTAVRPGKKKPDFSEGSFTVEAALVMPVVLFTLMGILWLFFYVHNRAVLTAGAHEAALLGSMVEMQGNGGGEMAAEERMQERLQSCAFGMNAADSSLGVSAGEEILVQCTSPQLWPVFGFRGTIETEGRAAVLHPARTIREYRVRQTTSGSGHK